MSHSFCVSARRARAFCSPVDTAGVAILLFATSLGVGIVHAQETEPLGLMAAVQLAEAQAPMIEARQAAVLSAQLAVGPAGQLPDPQLAVGIDSLPINTSDAFSLTRDSFTERTIGVMQAFPRSEKRQLRTERAEAMASREQALLLTERLSTREAVARAWIARATAERRCALLKALRPRTDAQIAAATAALSSGRGTAADGIAAQSARVMLDDRISEAERQVDDALADFARWLPDVANRPLGDAPDWADLGRDPNALLADISHHRELLAYDAAEQAANADVSLALADKRPDWSVELRYAKRGPQFSDFVSLQFRIDLPIFPKNRQNPLIASKQAAVAQLDAEREAARRMHTAELAKTLATWRSATDRVRRYERELLPLAEDRADATLAAYRGGRTDLQASLSALNDAIEQRIAYTELLNTQGQSWAGLHFAFAEER